MGGPERGEILLRRKASAESTSANAANAGATYTRCGGLTNLKITYWKYLGGNCNPKDILGHCETSLFKSPLQRGWIKLCAALSL